MCTQVGLADACIDPKATVGRVLDQLAQLHRHEGVVDMRTYDMAMHYLADCNTKDSLTAPLLLVEQGAPCACTPIGIAAHSRTLRHTAR